jgi:hypothetical protein
LIRRRLVSRNLVAVGKRCRQGLAASVGPGLSSRSAWPRRGSSTCTIKLRSCSCCGRLHRGRRRKGRTDVLTAGCMDRSSVSLDSFPCAAESEKRPDQTSVRPPYCNVPSRSPHSNLSPTNKHNTRHGSLVAASSSPFAARRPS